MKPSCKCEVRTPKCEIDRALVLQRIRCLPWFKAFGLRRHDCAFPGAKPRRGSSILLFQLPRRAHSSTFGPLPAVLCLPPSRYVATSPVALPFALHTCPGFVFHIVPQIVPYRSPDRAVPAQKTRYYTILHDLPGGGGACLPPRRLLIGVHSWFPSPFCTLRTPHSAMSICVHSWFPSRLPCVALRYVASRSSLRPFVVFLSALSLPQLAPPTSPRRQVAKSPFRIWPIRVFKIGKRHTPAPKRHTKNTKRPSTASNPDTLRTSKRHTTTQKRHAILPKDTLFFYSEPLHLWTAQARLRFSRRETATRFVNPVVQTSGSQFPHIPWFTGMHFSQSPSPRRPFTSNTPTTHQKHTKESRKPQQNHQNTRKLFFFPKNRRLDPRYYTILHDLPGVGVVFRLPSCVGPGHRSSHFELRTSNLSRTVFPHPKDFILKSEI